MTVRVRYLLPALNTLCNLPNPIVRSPSGK